LGGSGGDTLLFNSTVDSGITIDAGADNDSVYFSLALTGTNVLLGAGDDNLSFANSISQVLISLDAGADVVSFGFSSAATNSTVVGGSNSSQTIQFSSVADLVSLSGTFGAGSLFGGSGDDTLVFLAGAAVNAATVVKLEAGNDSLVFNNNILSGAFGGGDGDDVFRGNITIGTSGVSFWGGSGNDTFNFTNITGLGAGSTAYFWNDKTGSDSIVFGSVVSTGSAESGAVAFGITLGSGLAISFLGAQTTDSFGLGISNLFQVGNSNAISFGINSTNNYISIVFAGTGTGITLQGFESAEAIGITNTFGTGTAVGVFGTVASIPTFS